jgi:hypothetical protein
MAPQKPTSDLGVVLEHQHQPSPGCLTRPMLSISMSALGECFSLGGILRVVGTVWLKSLVSLVLHGLQLGPSDVPGRTRVIAAPLNDADRTSYNSWLASGDSE